METLSENGRRRVYRVLLRVARADRRIDPAEVEALARARAELGLSEADARALEAEPPDAPLRLGKSPDERRVVARKMVELACADGDLARREMMLLLEVARAIELPEEQLDQALRRALAAAEAAGITPTYPAPSLPDGVRPPAGGIVSDDVVAAEPPSPELIAFVTPLLQGQPLAAFASEAIRRGYAPNLAAWCLERVERTLLSLEASAPADFATIVLGLAATLEIGLGWIELPRSWAREAAVRLRLEGLERACPRGAQEELPALRDVLLPITAALQAAAAAGVRGEHQAGALQALRETLAQLPPEWSEPASRKHLATLVTRGARTRPVDRARWQGRVERWLTDHFGRHEALLGLEQLALGHPVAFQQLRDDVAHAFPGFGAALPLASLLPWTLPLSFADPRDSSEAERALTRTRVALARWVAGQAPPRHELVVPLQGEGVRALRLVLDDPRDEPLTAPFVAWLEEYLAAGARFADGQTLEYGAFLLQIALRDGTLSFQAPDVRGFVPQRTDSLSDALRLTALHGAIANAFGLDVDPARLDRPLVVEAASDHRLRQALLRCPPEAGWCGFELRSRPAPPPPPGIDPSLLPSPEELEAIRLESARDTARPVSLLELCVVHPFLLPYVALPVGGWVDPAGPIRHPRLGLGEQLLADEDDPRLVEAFAQVAARCGRPLDALWPHAPWLEAS